MTTQIKTICDDTPPFASHFETAGPLRALIVSHLLGALVVAEGAKTTMPLHILTQADVEKAFDVADAVLATNAAPVEAGPLLAEVVAPDTSAATIAELRAEVARLHAELDAATAPPAPAPAPVTP